MKPAKDSSLIELDHVQLDPVFQRQVERLHHLTVWGRWIFAISMWLIVAPLSLWGLRYPISLMIEYFTWAALYYGLYFHPVPALGLAFCLAMTTAILIWQSRNILFGLPKREQQRLVKQVLYIRKQGQSHPLWKFVCDDGVESTQDR